MALTFGGATSDRVDHGTGVSFGASALSVLIWNYPTSNTGPQNLWWHSVVGSSTLRHSLERRFGDVDDYEVTVARVTTNGACITTGVNRPLNAWKFTAVTFADGDGGPRVFHGSLTAAAVEASYSSRSEGSGGVLDGSGAAMYVGNRAAFDEAFVGRIAVVQVFDRQLSLAEIISHQWRPRKESGCVLLAHYGFNGTSTQPDWSGRGNSGTVTGGAVAAHVPLGSVFADSIYVVGATGVTTHATTGALASGDAAVEGTAAHLTLHSTSGAFNAPDAAVTGSATHLTLHETSGTLTAQDSSVAGVAAHEHATVGTLLSSDATVAGAAEHTANGSFSTTGALNAAQAQVSGTAQHLTLHATSGDLISESALVTGVATNGNLVTRVEIGGGIRKYKSAKEEREALLDEIVSEALTPTKSAPQPPPSVKPALEARPVLPTRLTPLTTPPSIVSVKKSLEDDEEEIIEIYALFDSGLL